jgi:hypothetical protein
MAGPLYRLQRSKYSRTSALNQIPIVLGTGSKGQSLSMTGPLTINGLPCSDHGYSGLRTPGSPALGYALAVRLTVVDNRDILMVFSQAAQFKLKSPFAASGFS